MDAALPDVLNAMALSRKGIWMHVVRKKILSSLMEIYITLELNKPDHLHLRPDHLPDLQGIHGMRVESLTPAPAR